MIKMRMLQYVFRRENGEEAEIARRRTCGDLGALACRLHRLLIGLILLSAVMAMGCNSQPANTGSQGRSGTVNDAAIKQIEGKGVQIRLLANDRIEAVITPRAANPEELHTQLQQLAAMPNLERLVIDGDPLSKHDIVVLRTATVTDLVMSGPRFEDRHLQEIAVNFPKLKSLSLIKTSVTGEGFRFLADLKELTSLIIEYSPLKEAGGLSSCSELETVIVVGCHSPRSLWVDIAKIPSLRNLSVSESNFDARALKILAERDELVSLAMIDCRVPASMGMQIGDISSLADLRVAGSDVGDPFVEKLCQSATLQSLDLSGTRITDGAIKMIQKLRQLEVLDISDTDLSNECVDELCVMPNLQTVVLDGTNIDKTSRELLESCLQRNWERVIDRQAE